MITAADAAGGGAVHWLAHNHPVIIMVRHTHRQTDKPQSLQTVCIFSRIQGDMPLNPPQTECVPTSALMKEASKHRQSRSSSSRKTMNLNHRFCQHRKCEICPSSELLLLLPLKQSSAVAVLQLLRW